MNFKEVTHKVIDVVKETASFLKAEAEKISSPDIEEKGLHDLVTYVDQEAENRIVGRKFKNLFLSHNQVPSAMIV